MKITALLLLILGVLPVVGLGLLSLVLLLASIGAPGPVDKLGDLALIFLTFTGGLIFAAAAY